jgi:hypothetical protein
MSKDYDPDGSGAFYAIKCRKCRAKSSELYAVEACPIFFGQVRDAWNTRSIAALPPAVPDTTPDPAESHVDGWRVRVIEWATDETVKVVQCKGEREAKKIERGMGINMASEYYTEIDNKPRTTTTTTTPDPVSEAAKVLEKSRTARKAAFDEMWKVATEEFSLEATNNGGARYSITGDVINALWYAAIRALTKDGEDG